MKMQILAVTILTGAVFILNACGGGGGCTTDRQNGLELKFHEHDTGLPICGVSYKVTSGNYIEEGTSPSEGDFCNRVALLEERPGSYTVEVQKEGYGTATLNVDIFANECHVITERRDIDLEEI